MNMARFVITEAKREKLKARIAIAGPAGSGKTYTTLALASGITERDGGWILVMDTEHESSKRLSSRFGFFHMVVPDWHPQTFIDALHFAAQLNGPPGRSDLSGPPSAVIIDSLSHAWMGALAEVDKIAERSKSGSSFGAWRTVTPLHNNLVDAIVSAPFHLLVTMRSKTHYEQVKDDRTGKTKIEKMGMQPVMRDGVEYEFDLVIDMDQSHNAIVAKTRYDGLNYQNKPLDGGVFTRPGEALGRAIADWLDDGETAEQAAEREAAARAEAERMQAEKMRAKVLDRIEKAARFTDAVCKANPHLCIVYRALVELAKGEPRPAAVDALGALYKVRAATPEQLLGSEALELAYGYPGLDGAWGEAYLRIAALAELEDERAQNAIRVIEGADVGAVFQEAEFVHGVQPDDRRSALRDAIARLEGFHPGGDEDDPFDDDGPVDEVEQAAEPEPEEAVEVAVVEKGPGVREQLVDLENWLATTRLPDVLVPIASWAVDTLAKSDPRAAVSLMKRLRADVDSKTDTSVTLWSTLGGHFDLPKSVTPFDREYAVEALVEAVGDSHRDALAVEVAGVEVADLYEFLEQLGKLRNRKGRARKVAAWREAQHAQEAAE